MSANPSSNNPPVSTDTVDTSTGAPPRTHWVEHLLKFIALLAGLVLVSIMILVSVAVYRRYVLNDPILGDTEFVEIGMSLVVMMAMPFVTLKSEHIRVDILDPYLGNIGRFFGDVFARLASCFVLVLLIRKTWDKTLEAIEYEDVTNMIELPVWIPYGIITLGFSLVVLVLAGQLFSQFRRGWADYE